jgi:hypothetical protein
VTSVLKTPAFAFSSSPVFAVDDTPTPSDFDKFANAVQKKLDQVIREAVSHQGEGVVIKPHYTVKIIGIAEAGTTVFKVFFGDENVPTFEQLVGVEVTERLGLGINSDNLDDARAQLAARRAARAQFQQLVADVTAQANAAGISNVLPVWLADPAPPVRYHA